MASADNSIMFRHCNPVATTTQAGIDTTTHTIDADHQTQAKHRIHDVAPRIVIGSSIQFCSSWIGVGRFEAHA